MPMRPPRHSRVFLFVFERVTVTPTRRAFDKGCEWEPRGGVPGGGGAYHSTH